MEPTFQIGILKWMGHCEPQFKVLIDNLFPLEVVSSWQWDQLPYSVEGSKVYDTPASDGWNGHVRTCARGFRSVVCSSVHFKWKTQLLARM